MVLPSGPCDSAAELGGVLCGDHLGTGVNVRLDVLAVGGVERRLRAHLTHAGRELGDRGQLVAGHEEGGPLSQLSPRERAVLAVQAGVRIVLVHHGCSLHPR